LGVQNVDTSILYFLIGNHTRVTKIEPKIKWLCALGNLDALYFDWTPPNGTQQLTGKRTVPFARYPA
jgi:hypothetical protein